MKSFKKQYGNWALITGGSSGIGLGFTTALARRGINSIIISNQQEQLDGTCRSITEEFPVEIVPCLTDLSETDFLTDIEKVVGDREISILINNASYGMVGDFLDHPIEA